MIHRSTLIALIAPLAVVALTGACATPTPQSRLYDALHDHELARAAAALEAGVTPNDLDPYGVPFLVTAANADDVAGIRLLLAKGGDVNIRDPANGWTALMTAARWSKVGAVRALIEAKADVNAKATDGRTALQLIPSDAGEDGAVIAADLIAAGATQPADAPAP